MNVRRKEPERCTLETPAYLTRSLRTCAASAPVAVVPARGIWDPAGPAPVPVACELSRPHEETAAEAIRRIDALCPWLVGAERREAQLVGLLKVRSASKTREGVTTCEKR